MLFRFMFAVCLLAMALAAAPLLAQEAALDCPAVIQAEVNAALEACAGLEVGQACFGGGPLRTIRREGADAARFSQPGDRLSLSDITTLTSGPFNAETGGWGLAVLRVRANLPQAAATFLAVGQVTLENNSSAGPDFIALEVTVTNPTGANVRAQPDEAAPLADVLQLGRVVTAVGRTADGGWLLVIVPGTSGWLRADLVRANADPALLEVVTAQTEGPRIPYSAMQDFTLRPAEDLEAVPCAEIPDSGLVVQTPGVGVLFILNGVALVVNGTVFIQAPSAADLHISVLEGEAAFGEAASQPIAVGQRLKLSDSGPDIQAEYDEYAYFRARYLPLPLLPREIDLPFALGDLIFPFVPGTGFLSTVPADAPCTVVWAVDVNLRAGPGVEYPLRRGVPAGFYGRPDARAQGTDGKLWWRLADGIWLLAENTAAGGACGTLPLIEPPPLPAQES